MTDWKQAACIGEDRSLFFPKQDEFVKADLAKEICARCSIREACLDLALQRREIGVWGGTSERERRRIRRARRRGI